MPAPLAQRLPDAGQTVAVHGARILFSMRRDGEDWFNLYEIGADGSGLEQLTDGPFNDVSGVYLPDGRIVFISDRAGYLEEYHEEWTETLWIMNGDGTGIDQLTFNPGTVYDPTVLADGRVLLGRSYQLQKKLNEALATWRDYLAKHPAHKAWSEVQRQVINTEYLMGLEEFRAEQFDAARKLWSEFLVKYPLDRRNPRILFHFGDRMNTFLML